MRVLFVDCDDTLVETERIAFNGCARALNEVLAAKNIARRYSGEELLHRFIGQNFGQILTVMSEELGFELSRSEFDAAVESEVGQVVAAFRAASIPAQQEILDVLRSFKDRGLSLVVVSTSARVRVNECLRSAGFYPLLDPNKIYSGASLPIPKSKPDPAVYLAALKGENVTASDAVAIEDSQSGVRSARGAGIPVIGILHFVPNDEHDVRRRDLLEAGAFMVVDHWRDIPRVINA